ncbi:MAG: adaptor protein MecA [Lachnospiraceae bacterium]|nr:adaptor protein MecA [Lachnospiraceae bacterium]
MKIERVDDKTVKCFLSNEELEEYNIDYKDFIARTERAREVMQQIIETASEEVGYKPPKFAFDLQIMMMPEQGMVLTLSEKDPIDLNDKEQVISYLKGLKDLFQMAKERFEAAGSAWKEAEVPPEKNSEPPKASGQEIKHPDFAIFRFGDMRSVLAYASVMPSNLRMKSALYVMDGAYYLYLHRGGASYERYSRACVQAMEFGSIYAAEEGRLVHLQEHGECLIEEGALKKLRF